VRCTTAADADEALAQWTSRAVGYQSALVEEYI